LVDTANTDCTPKSVKARAVLAMLALSPRGSRSRVWLRHKLWSDKTEDQSGASLRQALLDIRRSLGDKADLFVHSDKNTVSLNLDLFVLDLQRLIDGRIVGLEQTETNFSVEDNFLDGLPIRDPEFQDWVAKERAIVSRRLADTGLEIDLQPKTKFDLAPQGLPQVATAFAATHPNAGPPAWKLVVAPSKSIGLSGSTKAYQREITALMQKSFLETGDFELQNFDGPFGYIQQIGQHVVGTLGVQTTIYNDGPQFHADISLTDAASQNLLWVGQAQTTARPDGTVPIGFGHNLVSRTLIEATQYLTQLSAQRGDTRIATAVSAMFRLSKADLEKSEQILLDSIHLKPSAQAYAWLAFNMTFRVGQRMSFGDVIVIEQAQEYALKALELDRGNALVATLVAHVHSYLFGEYDFAAGLFEQALKSNPTQTLAWNLYGILHAYAGQPRKALSMANWACNLGSQSPHLYYFDTTRAIAANFAGEHRTAIEAGTAALNVRPDFNSLLRVLVSSHAQLGEMAKAERFLQKLRHVEPDFSIAALREAGYPGLDTEGGRDFIKGLLKAGVAKD
jgi:tetratricopeptide (TPR) repeat protein